jgi:hypothetical protein
MCCLFPLIDIALKLGGLLQAGHAGLSEDTAVVQNTAKSNAASFYPENAANGYRILLSSCLSTCKISN